jgi:hypothetical protein
MSHEGQKCGSSARSLLHFKFLSYCVLVLSSMFPILLFYAESEGWAASVVDESVVRARIEDQRWPAV